MGVPIFSVWIGKPIPEKYLIRMNTIWSKFSKKKEKEVEFIIYTDNIYRMHRSIFTCSYDIPVIRRYAKIIHISCLLEVYDQCVLKALSSLKECQWIHSNIIHITPSSSSSSPPNGVEFSCDSKFPLRVYPWSWALLSTCYLRRFLWHDAVFAARGTLNLRLIALAIHGGLYLDWDIMTIDHLTQHHLLEAIECSHRLRKKVALLQSQLHAMKSHHPSTQMQVLMKFLKSMQSSTYPGLLLPVIPFYHTLPEVQQAINTVLNTLQQYTQSLLETCRTAFLHNQPSQPPDSLVEQTQAKKKKKLQQCSSSSAGHKAAAKQLDSNEQGIFAISSNTVIHQAVAKFSQNVLLVLGNEAQGQIESSFVAALWHNILLAMLSPGSYWILKTNSHLQIVPYDLHPLLIKEEHLQQIVLPLDVFFTRQKFPYLVLNGSQATTSVEVTYRTGRPLHPLGQLATRGGWNFLLHVLTQLPTCPERIISCEQFSAMVFGIPLLPESSVIREDRHKPQQDATHWTKIKLKQLPFHEI